MSVKLIDPNAMAKLVAANKGKRGFTYTHHEPVPHNVGIVRACNRNGFTINWSANNLAHADMLADLNAGPVVSIGPSDQLENTKTPAGRDAIICPAVIRENVNCAKCKMCALPDRETVIVFPGHGAQKKAVDAIVNS